MYQGKKYQSARFNGLFIRSPIRKSCYAAVTCAGIASVVRASAELAPLAGCVRSAVTARAHVDRRSFCCTFPPVRSVRPSVDADGQWVGIVSLAVHVSYVQCGPVDVPQGIVTVRMIDAKDDQL